jgi:hypothetical protein
MLRVLQFNEMNVLTDEAAIAREGTGSIVMYGNLFRRPCFPLRHSSFLSEFRVRAAAATTSLIGSHTGLFISSCSVVVFPIIRSPTATHTISLRL